MHIKNVLAGVVNKTAEPCSLPRVFRTRGHARRYLDNSCLVAVLIQLVLEVGPRFRQHSFLGAFLWLISLKLWGKEENYIVQYRSLYQYNEA